MGDNPCRECGVPLSYGGGSHGEHCHYFRDWEADRKKTTTVVYDKGNLADMERALDIIKRDINNYHKGGNRSRW